ncbi:FMN-binding negative transcriptional regulator [Pseudarthrobacter chlorophenolicus A6]|uniref:FMN-binding negative transcriptional regulator n=1 Tax=Pseudarthrobacter chlorophenolicus (strain ATCC 700700 / DSM 12829 / CIP 107037 / JCM 12360 / KCTC 9906 / NCIMB 13794 / A6) TaxID=452863 RepID=B8HE97_PSECP|nr:FMN-binding negative transcriptional regulator [Pseudarthrobacter chlorophenolicus]ACL39132.1 FMN-binding negative transcriptional regulator [Pseudarthrobacter chlorophenolicus A6]SDR03855.1 negative transcriptional regulator, PaiB family [Pseudarthrobacter chlorophenolicus]
MYIPAHFAAGPEATRHLLTSPGAANLITMTDAGLLATLLPFVFEPDVGEYGALHAHVARNNPQATAPVTGEALAIIQGPDAYISPSWYMSKAEHGRVVPTWNYSTAHVYGELVVHDDAGWLARHVRRLTDRHEGEREHPWSVDDAPAKFIAGQLRAIVGIELMITRIEAKEKLSQNRSAADASGVVAGLRSSGQEASAAAVERVLAQQTPES